jgi:hypothetical protein
MVAMGGRVMSAASRTTSSVGALVGWWIDPTSQPASAPPCPVVAGTITSSLGWPGQNAWRIRLPPARAGVGSAVNDTVREFGGALGVAVIGSVAATSYASSMRHQLDRFPNLADADRTMITNNLGAALHLSPRLGPQGDQIASAARDAFVGSMNSSLWIAVGLASVAALVAVTQLSRPTAHASPTGAESATPLVAEAVRSEGALPMPTPTPYRHDDQQGHTMEESTS